MEIEFSDHEVIFNKELNSLDKLVIEFCGILDAYKINYVIISGYISILFGRTRTTEDVDIFIEKIPGEKFLEFYNALESKGFWIINSASASDAFEILSENLAIRVAEKEKTLPNFEIKFARKDSDFYSLERRLKLMLSGNKIFISPLEMNIAYKLLLGSHKDFEDAYHIYKLLKKHLDLEELKKLIKMLGVVAVAKKELADLYV